MPKHTAADHNVPLQPTVFDQLLEPIDEFVRNQERELPKHHNQKFSYYDFFRLLMYFFVAEGKSLKLFIVTILNEGLLSPALALRCVPYSTFGEAFERFPVTLFQAVFQHLLSTVTFRAIPELAALGRLYCIDGSLFPVISSMLWAEYTSKHQALKLHLCFELNRMLPVEFVVTAANFSERKALLQMLQAGITYIADRGYMSFNVCHQIVQAKAHFVFRVKAGLLFKVTAVLPVQLPEAVQAVFGNVTDELIRYTNDKFKQDYRLVCFCVAQETFRLLTDRRDLTTFQVIMLYAYRWQIELLFRFLKRTMNGIHLIKQDERGVTIQFYALLIVALLELRLKQKTADMDNGNDDRSSAKAGPEPSAEDVGGNAAPTADERQEGVVADEKAGPKAAVGVADQAGTRAANACQESAVATSQQQTEFDTGKPISSGYTFIETIGKKLKKYWKIGIHWLTALKRLLAKPFDQRAVEILNSS